MTTPNVVINIDTLNLDVVVHGEQKGNPFIDMILEGMKTGATTTTITRVPVEDHECEDAAPPASEGDPTAIEVDALAVIDFLESDTRYTMRSADSIAEHFGDTSELRAVIHRMLNLGQLNRKTRRSDGAVLLSVAAGARAAVTPQPVAEPYEDHTSTGWEDDVLDFLDSDPRYTQRSADAIAEFFNIESVQTVKDLMARLVSSGQVETRTRRRDGATLYEAV